MVFDRKKIATKTKKGLVQIEISFERKRKWISTDVKLYQDQWDDRRHVINHTDSLDLNDWLHEQVSSYEKWIKENAPFSWDKLDSHLKQHGEHGDFLSYLDKTIRERNDIRESTRKAHFKLINVLREWGGIIEFSDLTPDRIMDLDNYLHGRKIKKIDLQGIERHVKMRQQSIFNYHKLMKTYIGIAIRRGLMKDSPYTLLHFKRGESEPDRYLTEQELKCIENATMRSGSIARARDIFVFQCYTGLSYSDMAMFDFSKVKQSGHGTLLYQGKRIKTGIPFYFILLPKAVQILEKYNYRLPIVSDEALNRNLKVVAQCAGIDKPIASHWARRTAAMMFANKGIRMEVVAKILGHSTTKTTQQFYASISAQTVAQEMEKLNETL